MIRIQLHSTAQAFGMPVMLTVDVLQDNCPMRCRCHAYAGLQFRIAGFEL